MICINDRKIQFTVRFDLFQEYSIEKKIPIKSTHLMRFYFFGEKSNTVSTCLPPATQILTYLLRRNIHSRSHSTWKIRRPVATAAYYLIFTNFNNSLYLHQRLEPTYLQAIIVLSFVLDLKNYFQVSLHG